MCYRDDHKLCRNYEKEGTPSIEYKRAEKGKRIDSQFTENKIVIILEGIFYVTCGKYDDCISGGHMLVVPAGTPYMVQALTDTKYIVCRIKNNLHLCGEFSLEKLFHEEDTNRWECRPLEFCKGMQLYVTGLQRYLQDGIRCGYFFELKMKELLFLLRHYYSQDELRCFFAPLLSDDLHFSDFILKNHRKVKSVKDFADLAHYSISGFEKRFKKVFHVSAYRWMKDQKAKEILHELHTSSKTFKEIGWEYGFTSPAQFNDFCKAHFGMTPGQIRSSVMKPDD